MSDREKWSSDLDGEMPLRDAAREIVRRRLEPLPRLLALAREDDGATPEPVHRLRVATRRADAALTAFRPCFKASRWKRTRKMLKRIRRAAGAARVCDVHVMLLEAARSTVAEADREALDYAIHATRGEREDAQPALHDVAARFPSPRLKKRIRKLLRSTRTPRADRDEIEIIATVAGAPPTLADAARSELPEFIARVRRAAADDLSVLDNLHTLRLRCKGLRYALEVFAPCFDAAFRPRVYAPVKEHQDRLGEINDAHEIALRFDELLATLPTAASDGDDASSLRGGLERLRDDALASRDAMREAFLAGWRSLDEQTVLETLEEWAARTPADVG